MMGVGSLLRFGGQLRNATVEYSEKYPIILPKHRISDLLIDHAHRAMLHGGTQLMLRTLRQEYWIVGCRNLVKAHIRECVICARQAAKNLIQLMICLLHVFFILIRHRRSRIPASVTPDLLASYRS